VTRRPLGLQLITSTNPGDRFLCPTTLISAPSAWTSRMRELAELRRRIAATRWPERETVADQSRACNWRRCRSSPAIGARLRFRRFEARLNALPQFITEIDGLDIHFIHVKSPHENALPLIITHGWPGSVIEMLNAVGPLTDRRHTAATPRMRSMWWFRRYLARVLRETDGSWLGPCPHRGFLDRADEAPGIYAIRSRKAAIGVRKSRM